LDKRRIHQHEENQNIITINLEGKRSAKIKGKGKTTVKLCYPIPRHMMGKRQKDNELY